ncbi:hypothetical protein Nepgr_019554 [Nepenthes gracilis]|uniref:26S proteasome non-ATPase regulatory subunit 14 n=1 Tax=Nepenthes gracilis TaxID=150966 RepID=A0AAD3XUH3_NEPGR|nr:hypothetical protein Nepgr_019554 [Nepenthes gracilis]
MRQAADLVPCTGMHMTDSAEMDSPVGWQIVRSSKLQFYYLIEILQSFEVLNQPDVAVVVGPIQGVKGKVVIDLLHLINPQTMMLGQEPQQTTSNLGHHNKPSIQALIHGLNRHYYSIAINYRRMNSEEEMLLNLHRKKWTDGLTLQNFNVLSKTNVQTSGTLVKRPSSMKWDKL